MKTILIYCGIKLSAEEVRGSLQTEQSIEKKKSPHNMKLTVMKPANNYHYMFPKFIVVEPQSPGVLNIPYKLQPPEIAALWEGLPPQD